MSVAGVQGLQNILLSVASRDTRSAREQQQRSRTANRTAHERRHRPPRASPLALPRTRRLAQRSLRAALFLLGRSACDEGGGR